MAVSETLRLRPGAAFDPEGPAIAQGMARLPFRDASPKTLAALDALASDGLDTAGLAADPPLGLLVTQLEASGWLARTVAAPDRPLATREPLAFADVLSRRGFDAAVPVKLSRLCLLGVDDGRAVLESGAARARVVLHEPRLAALGGLLAEPVAAGELDPGSLGLAGGELEAVLRLLLGARLVVRVDGGSDPERDDPNVAQWAPVDLLFHARTRLGRRGGGYGGTYPFRERFPQPPALRPAEEAEQLQLPRPDLTEAAASDPPLTQAIEARHSIREHDDEHPIGIAQLGELLFRAARVTRTVESDEYGSFALRPYPNGGALYELELYPAVHRCEGLAPGLYRYDPAAHRLARVAEDGPPVHGLLEHARVAALMESRPQVLLVVAARFGRVSWKYEAMPYALTLKHVGVLYQTLYLVATAMGLAPCGLGGGDSDLFARAAGLEYTAETSVGEFILGSRVPGSAGPGLEAVAQATPSF